MPKSPFQDWLEIQEHARNRSIFLVEWLSLFAIAWLFWSALFFSAPGSLNPALAATILSGLYATCMIYGRSLKATGCRVCSNPMPFLRYEVGRWHLPDVEKCVELEFGGEEWDQHFVHVYCKVARTDVVAYRCRKCGKAWDEKVELPGTGYKLIRRLDLKK